MRNEIVNVPISTESLRSMFLITRINVYEPFGWLLKAFVQRSAIRAIAMLGMSSAGDGVDAHAQRAATLGLHAAAAALLYCLVSRILALVSPSTPCWVRKLACAAAAAAWGVHPIHAEVVGWPSAQPYSLALVWALLALHCRMSELQITLGPSLHSQRAKLFTWRLLGPLLYLAATMSKSVVLPLPAALLALDLALGRGQESGKCDLRQTLAGFLRYTVCELSIWALVAGTMACVTIQANTLGTHEHTDVLHLSSLRDRAVKGMLTTWFIVRQTIWPLSLRPHYAISLPAELDLGTPGGAEACLATAGTLASALVACSALRLRPWLTATWLHVGATLLPTCGLIQHGMIQRGGDRYAYLPSLVCVPLLAALLISFWPTHRRTPEPTKRPATTDTEIDTDGRAGRSPSFTLALVALLVVGTCWAHLASLQVRIWANDATMFDYSLSVDPRDWRILDTYGEYLLGRGDDERAREMMARSIDALPLVASSMKATLTHAKNHFLLGDADSACALYQAAIQDMGGYTAIASAAARATASASMPKHSSSLATRFSSTSWDTMFVAPQALPNAMIISNAATCALRDASQRNAQDLTYSHAVVLEQNPDHRANIEANHAEYRKWRDSGFHGNFHGKLLW